MSSPTSPRPTPTTFIAPDEGCWDFDAAHQTVPFSGLACTAWGEGYSKGFERGFAEVGALLSTMDVAFVNNWFYHRPRPLGGPPTAKRLPPKLLFKLLLRLVPALRRRVARAETLWERRPWLSVPSRWFDESLPAFEARLAPLRAAMAPEARPLGERVEALARLLDLFEDAAARHLELAVPECIALGNVLVHLEDHAPDGAASARHLMGLVRGAQVESRRPQALQRAVVDAIVAAGGRERLLATAHDPAPERALADLRGLSAEVDACLDAYLDAYGGRLLIQNLREPTLAERPDQVLLQLRAQLLPRDDDDAAAAARALEAEVAATLPAAQRAELARVVDEARRSATSREARTGFLFELFGGLRRLALRVGEALVAEGRLRAASDAFELRRDELPALAGGQGPGADELAQRSADFLRWATLAPPRRLGEAAPPPPLDWLPAASARLTRAVFAYISRFDEGADVPAERPPLTGLGVSPGVVEGRAIVVHTGADLARIAPGDILVALTTGVSFNPVIPVAAGLVTERGGLASHASVVTRELGLPCVVGCKDATTAIPDGALVRLDGDAGRVEILDAAPDPAPRPAAPLPPATPAPTPRVPAEPGACVPLREATEVGRFGGKAAPLAVALGAELPVPPGLALDADFAEAVACGDAAHLERLRAALAGLPGPWAVRSSALDEDGASASFAGIHETQLSVATPAAAVEAVGAVWRSAHSAAATAYRGRRGLTASPRMAVVIQRMLAPEWSGVRFGCDPVSGADVRIIEIAPGLGTAVVDGETLPERVRTDAAGAVSSHERGDHGRVLDDDRVAAIHSLCARCDALFGGPQDVELAWAAGALWLLQSRPMTTGGRP